MFAKVSRIRLPALSTAARAGRRSPLVLSLAARTPCAHAHLLRALADRVADQRNVREQIEQLRDAIEQERDESLRDAHDALPMPIQKSAVVTI